MKKLVILLLTIFTISTAAVCGCGSSKENSSFEDKKDVESIRIQEIDEVEQDNPECPDGKKRDGECPAPRRPHKRHDRKAPPSKSTYIG